MTSGPFERFGPFVVALGARVIYLTCVRCRHTLRWGYDAGTPCLDLRPPLGWSVRPGKHGPEIPVCPACVDKGL